MKNTPTLKTYIVLNVIHVDKKWGIERLPGWVPPIYDSSSGAPYPGEEEQSRSPVEAGTRMDGVVAPLLARVAPSDQRF